MTMLRVTGAVLVRPMRPTQMVQAGTVETARRYSSGGYGASAVAAIAAERRALAGSVGQTATGAGMWFWAVALAVALWSVTYLIRQPGVAMGEPISLIGNFALEGMLLALAWLALMATGALAILTGAATVITPDDDDANF